MTLAHNRSGVVAQAQHSIRGSVIDSIAQRTPSRPSPEPFTPPNG
jgi:hypothetical protein